MTAKWALRDAISERQKCLRNFSPLVVTQYAIEYAIASDMVGESWKISLRNSGNGTPSLSIIQHTISPSSNSAWQIYLTFQCITLFKFASDKHKELHQFSLIQYSHVFVLENVFFA